jgi:hypothetical protein
MDRVADIIATWAQADGLEADVNALRWRVAEMITAELADGKSQRQLAREIGKHHSHVGRMAKCREWRLKSPEPAPFNEVYNSPEVRKPHALRSGSEGSGGRQAPRDTYGRFKTATFEFAQACIEAKRNGRSLRQIAEAADAKVHYSTVRRAILAVSQCNTPDDFDRKYSAVVKDTNGSKPKPLTSGSEGSGGRQAPRDAYGRFKTAILEFARACEAAEQNGHSGREIANAAGGDEKEVRDVLALAELLRE